MATIQGVYVALFGRPADPAGLAYFNGVTKQGADLSAIGDLASTQEYKDRFAGQSNLQIISSIYQSLFNRAPEAAGLEFFANALNKGTLSINNIAIAILDGAQGDDKTIVTNKITAADNFTKALDTATEQAAYTGNGAAQLGRNFLTPVAKDSSTIPSTAATDAAVKGVVDAAPGSTGTEGVTIQLTAATDAVSPNAANPSFKSTAGNDTINAGHFISNDTNIDAGAGIDTLNVKSAASGAAADAISGTPTLAGVEKVVVTAVGGNGTDAASATPGTAGGSGNVTLDLSKASGVQEIWNVSSKAGTAGVNFVDAVTPANSALGGAAGTAVVTFNNIASGVQLGLKGAINDATTFSFKDVSGSSDSATLVLDGAQVTAGKLVTISGVETLNLSVKAGSSLDLVDADAKTIAVTGTGDLTINGAGAKLDALTKFDASALNGKLTLDLVNSDSGAGVTVTGTKLADVVKLGAGKDVVVFNSANISTKSLLDKVDAFAGGTNGDKLDVKAFALTGAHAVTDFTADPVDGTSFVGNAIGKFGNVYYFDSNNDGKINIATDLAVDLTGATGTFSATDNVIWS